MGMLKKPKVPAPVAAPPPPPTAPQAAMRSLRLGPPSLRNAYGGTFRTQGQGLISASAFSKSILG